MAGGIVPINLGLPDTSVKNQRENNAAAMARLQAQIAAQYQQLMAQLAAQKEIAKMQLAAKNAATTRSTLGSSLGSTSTPMNDIPYYEWGDYIMGRGKYAPNAGSTATKNAPSSTTDSSSAIAQALNDVLNNTVNESYPSSSQIMDDYLARQQTEYDKYWGDYKKQWAANADWESKLAQANQLAELQRTQGRENAIYNRDLANELASNVDINNPGSVAGAVAGLSGVLDKDTLADFQSILNLPNTIGLSEASLFRSDIDNAKALQDLDKGNISIDREKIARDTDKLNYDAKNFELEQIIKESLNSPTLSEDDKKIIASATKVNSIGQAGSIIQTPYGMYSLVPDMNGNLTLEFLDPEMARKAGQAFGREASGGIHGVGKPKL